MAETQQDKIIRILKAEAGQHEGKKNGHWDNIQKYSEQTPGLEWSDGQAWCDTFVHWGAYKAGVISLWPDVTKTQKGGSASCDVSGAAFKKAGRWSEYPAIAAQVFFGKPTDLNHTGLVWKYDGTYIWTIEGNTNTTGAVEGDGVYLKKHERRSTNVIGYGYPAYAGGIKSADPEWATGKKAKAGTVQPPASTPGALRRDLVDLSHHNIVTQAGLMAAAKSGVRGFYHKATEATTFRDPKYSVVRGMNTKGPKARWGATHYAQPGESSGKAQALYFLKVAGVNPGNMPPMLDVEVTGGLSVAALDHWVGDFVSTMRASIGCGPIIYDRNLVLKTTHGCLLWTSRYSNTNLRPELAHPWTKWTVWQFSDGVYGNPRSCPGLGKVDLDTINTSDAAKWLESFKVPAKPKAPAKPVPKPPVIVLPKPPIGTGTTTGKAQPYKRLQCNIQGTDTFKVAAAHIEVCAHPTNTAHKPQVIVWNEVTTYALQKKVASLPDYGSYPVGLGDGDKKNDEHAVVISWDRSRFKYVLGYTRVLNKGAKGFSPVRVIHTVLLEDRLTGVHHFEQGTHTPHHVDVNGKARVTGLLLGQNQRAKSDYAEIADSIHNHSDRADLFGSGDLNVDFKADRAHVLKGDATAWFPCTVLGKVARLYYPNDHGGTHGGRLIDWGWITGDLAVTDVIVLDNGSSDHNPVLWTILQGA